MIYTFSSLSLREHVNTPTSVMINKIVFSAMLSFIFSCHSPTKESHEGIEGPITTIPFQVGEINKMVLPDIVSEESFVHLQTHDDALIGKINKIVQHGDRFYVLDSRIAKAILCFNDKGDFIFKIENFLDHEDFREVQFSFEDFVLDEKLGTVEVFDERNQQILIFDLDGDYQGRFHLPFSAMSFEKSDTGEYIFFRGNAYSPDPAYDYELIHGDGESFSALKRFRNQRRSTPKVGTATTSLYPSIVLSRLSDEVRYMDFFSDTVYSIKGDKISDIVYLDMGKQSPQSIYGSRTNDEIFDQLINNELKGYIQTKHIIYEDLVKTVFSISYDNLGILAVFDKSKRNTIFYQMVDDATLGLESYSFLSNGVFPGDKVLICVRYAGDREAERLNYKEEKNPSLMLLQMDKL